ncbi:MAG: alpha/beta fold hydrolase [Oligoflexus sp.]
MDATWQDETLESFDSVELFGFQANPQQEAKASVILVHGYGEQSEAYRELIGPWLAENFAVYVFDLRGHGRSGGDRGYVRQFEDYLDDLDLIYARVQDRNKKQPIFLIGQDLGALIAGMFTASRKPLLAGLILCGLPWQLPVTPLQQQVVRSMASFMPKRPFGPQKLKRLAFGEEAPESEKFIGFAGKGMPARVLWEILQALTSLSQDADNLQLPLFLIQARQDPYGDVSKLEDLQERAMSYDKTCWLLDGGQHRLLKNNDRLAVSPRIISWLNERYDRPNEVDEMDEQSENF